MNTILDGTPSHKKLRYTQDVPLLDAPLEPLATLSSMHDSVSGIAAAPAPKNWFGRTLLPSYRGEFTYANSSSKVDTTTTTKLPEITHTDGSRYGRWTQPSTTDDDDDYDGNEDVFYDSSSVPASTSATSTSAMRQSQARTVVVSTPAMSRALFHLSFSDLVTGDSQPRPSNNLPCNTEAGNANLTRDTSRL